MKECAVCHRTSDDVQVNYCTKAGCYLCSKHKNQLYRHGQFLPDDKPRLKCDVCGKEGHSKDVSWCSNYGGYLCNKHRAQFVRLGHFLEKTKRDRNDYLIHEDYAEILFRNSEQNVIGSALIDVEDVEKCSLHKWYITEMMGNSQYVKSVIQGVTTSLHRFILNYDGNMVIDHINRNGLDNRKCNLRIVSNSENCVNSNVRSATGEKNIYRKGNRFQVQIIRNYKQVFTATFDTLDEAIAARDSFIQQYNQNNDRQI